MAATTTRPCPKCGGSLTPTAGDSTRRTCSDCGASFSVRTKPAAVAASAPVNDFARLDAPSRPAPRRVPPPTAAPRPAAGTNQHLVLGLVLAAALTVALLGLTTAIVLAVVFWPRPAVQPTAVAVAPVDPPAAPPGSAEESQPPQPQAPVSDDPKPPPPPNKPAPPKDDPLLVHDAPPLLPTPAPARRT